MVYSFCRVPDKKGAIMLRHLCFEDRVKIQYIVDANQDVSARAIADHLGVSASTVVREIRRAPKPIKGSFITKNKEIPCKRLEPFPHRCNGCPHLNQCCGKDKVFYDAYQAEWHYRAHLRDSIKRNDKKAENVKRIEAEISPKVKAGQSIEAALHSSSIGLSASTVRRYCDAGLLYKRMYQDYVAYMASGGHRRLELDTVMGTIEDKHTVLTIFDPRTKIQFGYKILKGSGYVNQTVVEFCGACELHAPRLFDVILTDNGVEFQGLPEIEADPITGVARFRTFYCDPYRSGQKGGCERNHEILRFQLEKGRSIDSVSREDLTEMFSQMNSYPRKSQGNQTPIQVFRKLHGGALLEALGVCEIPPGNINFKRFRR